MKVRSGKFGDLIINLFLLLLGVGLIYGNLGDRKVGDFIAKSLDIPFVDLALGVLLVLSVIQRWVGGLGRKKAGFIDFHTDDGSVGISTKAIQDFIERVGKEFAAVKSIQSTLIQKKGVLDVAIKIKVRSGNKIPELSQMLQQRIRESVRESLGLEEIGNITIKVQEIVGDPAVKALVDEPESNFE